MRAVIAIGFNLHSFLVAITHCINMHQVYAKLLSGRSGANGSFPPLETVLARMVHPSNTGMANLSRDSTIKFATNTHLLRHSEPASVFLLLKWSANNISCYIIALSSQQTFINSISKLAVFSCH